jgi:hypothetical protein
VDPSHPLLLPRENGRALDRYAVTRYINKAGAAAGLSHIHPHQLRHTLATQAINRGMSLEAIAAMLGHRSLDMTLRYAKIASRTVADEYFAVTGKVEALYGQDPVLPADAIGPKMARLRREHHRMLGNGYCTRPPELDCAFESICETCTFFQTSIEFRPTLQAQHDDATAKHQTTAGSCSPRCSPASTRTPHEPPALRLPAPASCPHPPPRRQPRTSSAKRSMPSPAAHHLLARRLRRPPARPGQPHRPSRTPAAPTPSTTPATRTHLAPDRPATQHRRRYRGPPLPEPAYMINLTRITHIMPLSARPCR